MSERITSPCPACGRTTLIVGSGGYLVCGFVGKDGCPNPCAADKVLTDAAEVSRQLREARAFIAAHSSLTHDR